MLIGYSLVLQETGAELQTWDAKPAEIIYKGESRTGVIPGAEVGHDAWFVERWLSDPVPDGNPPVASESTQYQNGRIIVTRSYGEHDIVPIKAAAMVSVDAAAENARLRYITPGSGQALEYRAVQEEASRYVATGGAGQYPMLQASVNAGEAVDLAAAAAMVNAREAAWSAIGAQIRQLRIAAKRAISAATTLAQVQAAVQVEWP